MYGRSHDQNGKWSDADFANTKYFVCQCGKITFTSGEIIFMSHF